MARRVKNWNTNAQENVKLRVCFPLPIFAFELATLAMPRVTEDPRERPRSNTITTNAAVLSWEFERQSGGEGSCGKKAPGSA